MRKSINTLLFALLLGACHNSVPVKIDKEKADFARIKEMNDYSSYLNEVIKLEQKYQSTGLAEVWIPVRFYDVQPLGGASLFDKETDPIIEHLNTQFKAANIQFYLDAPIENVYSSVSVDMLYGNRKLETDFFEKHYKTEAINIYIVKNAQDVLGFTHYPDTEIQRIFVADKDLMGASLIHEMGHFMGLLHTFEGVSSANHSGCDYEGDKICDTPKDDTKISFIENECQIYGTYKDEKGEDLQPDLNNYMSYYGTCRTTFSTQQLKRMNFIANKIKLPQLSVGS
jgi:Pregnancy-associated plasma protein-A